MGSAVGVVIAWLDATFNAFHAQYARLLFLIIGGVVLGVVFAVFGAANGALGAAFRRPVFGGVVGGLMGLVVSGLWLLMNLPVYSLSDSIGALVVLASVGGVAGAAGGLAGGRVSDDSNPPPRWQFRLRSLLAVMLLLCLLLGWIGQGVHAARQKLRLREDLVVELQGLGGDVQANGELSVSLSGGQFGDESVKRLAEIMERQPSVFSSLLLDLSGSQTTDSGGRELRRVTSIRWLNLANTQVSDATLEAISTLPNLNILELSNAAISAQGISHLNRVELGHLDLSNCPIGNAGLAELAKQPPSYLILSNTSLTDSGLQKLEGLSFVWLDLSHNSLSDDAIVHLNALNRAMFLDLSGTNLTDEGLRQLSLPPGTCVLKLNDTQITDAGLVYLHTIRDLQEVEVKNTGVSTTAARQFRLTVPSVKIID